MKRRLPWSAALLAFAVLAPAPARAQAKYPFQDPKLPVERRIDDLLSRMTLEEKIAALSTNASVPRLGVEGSGNTEGLHGVAQGGPSNWGQRNPKPTTQFPQAVGLGETWDADLVRQVAAAEGYEARYLFQSARYHQGGIVVWAPNADLARDPRWGRTEESYGEDPFLTGTLAVAFVRGLQGDDPKYWQAASLMKHFLANSEENDRDSISANFDERLFREYYSVPFRMGVEQGGARAYMASYNSVNGIPMMVSPILRQVTIDQWGQDGIISTDGGALGLLISAHHYYPDPAWGAAAGVKAGINQFLDRYKEPIEQALKEGLVTEADIDHVLRGRYRVLIHLGQLDPPEMVPYRRIGAAGEPEPWTTAAHRALARRATRESIVLLKNAPVESAQNARNEGGLLPLDRARLKSVAVIGPRADSVLLDWYSGTPPSVVTPLDGIRAKLGSAVTVTYVDGSDSTAAANAAKSADVALVVVGNHPTCEGAAWAKCPIPSEGREAVDRESIDLAPDQAALVKTVLRANPRTVMVLVSSFPYAIVWAQQNVPAILQMAHSGEEMGNGLADVLFGDYDPAGRLVHTWPRSLADLPPKKDFDIRHGSTYMYFQYEPLYPFGYGLSYTSFAYRNLRTDRDAFASGDTLRISVDVTNTGKRAGDE
ncbi:MAG TPA: glycoside hydrolase family 3 C-terminal domain-containing protein, partial [Longimicrobiaceae bacterium]|nr:glycoside hydrolase family 3 C-terminal domain-containing protein [Longimicrobiaceae bacterium]